MKFQTIGFIILGVFGKTYDKMTEKEQTEANGVLDYSQWTPPPYKNHFGFWDEL